MERKTEKVTIQPPCGVKELLIDYSKPLLKDMPQGYITIPQGATNGDMIKKMFPKGKIRREISCTSDKTVFSFPDGTYFGAECRFNTDWWNAPYKLSEVNE